MAKKINSRAKGARGELELAAQLKEWGFDARRGQQFSGGGDSPDVIHNLGPFHLECKRVESGNLYKWMAQAKRDAAATKMPLVVHRRTREEWVVVMRLEDLLRLMPFMPDDLSVS